MSELLNVSETLSADTADTDRTAVVVQYIVLQNENTVNKIHRFYFQSLKQVHHFSSS